MYKIIKKVLSDKKYGDYLKSKFPNIVAKFNNLTNISDIDLIHILKKGIVYSKHKKEYKIYIPKQIIDKHNELRKTNLNNKFLDIGSGSGYKTKIVRELFNISQNDTICLELKGTSFITECEKKACIYKYYDGTVFPFPDNYFTLISSFHVIHHINNREFHLNEIARIIKPGGVLIIQEHDVLKKDKLLEKFLRTIHFIYMIEQNEPFEKYMPETYFSFRQLKKELVKVGFRFFDISKTGSIYNSYFSLFIKN